MDKELFLHVCELAKLSFSEEDGEAINRDMSDIIELMDKIKDINLVYDDTKDGGAVDFSDLREDVACASYPRDSLLQNTVESDGCYTVPRLME